MLKTRINTNKKRMDTKNKLKTQMANVKSTTQNSKLERQKQNYNLEIQILNPKVFLVLSFNM